MTQEKSISLIAAMDENRLIGRGDGLPWHLPNDLKHFKAHTLGKTILMGRKTWDTLGKPLPQREHWVLTRDTSFNAEGCRRFNDIGAALEAHLSVDAALHRSFLSDVGACARSGRCLVPRIRFEQVPRGGPNGSSC
jgi:dihydrofolate reductase